MNENNRRLPEEILGLQPGASLKLINRRFRELAKNLHPDLDPTHAEAFTEISQAVTSLRVARTSEFVVSTVVYKIVGGEKEIRDLGNGREDVVIVGASFQEVIPKARRLRKTND